MTRKILIITLAMVFLSPLGFGLKKPLEMKNSAVKGAYLGQEKPGITPKLFAPGFISTKKHPEFCLAFTNDGKTLYFGRRIKKVAILVTHSTPKGWTKPEKVSFSSTYGETLPHLTPDNQRLYFYSKRPLPGDKNKKTQSGIWYVDKKGEKWGEAVFFCKGFSASVANNKNLYFFYSRGNDGHGTVIGRKIFKNGKYEKTELLGKIINKFGAAHPFIARDESFLIFDTFNPEGQGKGKYPDYYVSFHKKDGSWTDHINLGNSINKYGHNNCATLSPDGKYLFYTYKGEIYWVNSKVISKLKK